MSEKMPILDPGELPAIEGKKVLPGVNKRHRPAEKPKEKQEKSKTPLEELLALDYKEIEENPNNFLIEAGREIWGEVNGHNIQIAKASPIHLNGIDKAVVDGKEYEGKTASQLWRKFAHHNLDSITRKARSKEKPPRKLLPYID